MNRFKDSGKDLEALKQMSAEDVENIFYPSCAALRGEDTLSYKLLTASNVLLFVRYWLSFLFDLRFAFDKRHDLSIRVVALYDRLHKVYVLPYMVPVLAGKKAVLAGVDRARTGVLGVILC